MASIAITITNTEGNAGAVLRKLAKQIEKAAAGVPDRVTTGGSTVLTIHDAPATGHASVQVTGGAYQSELFPV